LILVSSSTTDDPGELIDGWVTFLDTRGKPYEILLVNDAVLDKTADWSAKLAGRSSVRVLRDSLQRGSGAALRVALAAAQYPLLASVDADYRFAPADLERLLAEIDKVHLVIGLRAARRIPLGLRILGGIYRLLVRAIFGLPLER